MRRLTSAFFMFLQQVNKHNRFLLMVMVIFIAGQLFINYKRGMVVSPFFHYGMYSSVIDVKNSYRIFEVYQNGKKLSGQDYSPQEWDKIILPLQYYSGAGKSNDLYKTDIKRLVNKTGLSTNDSNFITNCNYNEFENWYKNYLLSITNKKTRSLVVHYRSYLYKNNTLQPTDSFLPLSQLCR